MPSARAPATLRRRPFAVMLLAAALAAAGTVAAIGAGDEAAGSSTPTTLRSDVWLNGDVAGAGCGTPAATAPTLFVADASTGGQCAATDTCTQRGAEIFLTQCVSPIAAFTATGRTYVVADLFALADCTAAHTTTVRDSSSRSATNTTSAGAGAVDLGAIGRVAIAGTKLCQTVSTTMSYSASCTKAGAIELALCADSICSEGCMRVALTETDAKCIPIAQLPFPAALVPSAALLAAAQSASLSCAYYHGSTGAHGYALPFNSPLVIGITMLVIASVFVGLFVHHYFRHIRHGGPNSSASGTNGTNGTQFSRLPDEEMGDAVPSGGH
eukprot:Unigene2568_Nuclearia_a/m.7921 Unigene2568_Nuclearia_a/g.7921  ORF Unigene2568_Nuclearia_a/g.7921 Unigene2568_Nuclearia_a/m.7921 type:complete len:327 (+) Unigene2568_Nuclearia_a:89-1069(+)